MSEIMAQTVQEVEVREITCFARCPVCGERNAFEMPGDLGAKEGEEISQVCGRCKDLVDIEVCLPRNPSSTYYSRSCLFLCELCNKGNPHAIALVKGLLDVPITTTWCDYQI